MINILVKLSVKDFDALVKFEQQAAKIMKTHQGRILSAFETERNADGSGEEIHVLEFPHEKAFSEYLADDSLAELKNLRNMAVSATEVKLSVGLKFYT